MALSRKLTTLSALALLAPLACADLIGLHPPKPDESGSGGLGGDGNQGTGATPNGDGGGESGGAGPDTGGGSSTGSASGTGGTGGTGGSNTGGNGSGGGSTGGNGTGGEPAIPEPTLITSSSSNYWVVDDVTEGGTTADVTVLVNQPQQTWHGFGVTFSERGWDVASDLDVDERAEALERIFDKENGAGFTWGRIPIGASDYAMDRYTLNETDDDLDMVEFSIERDEQDLIPFVQAAQAVNPDIKFWGVPYTPPTWMKDNDSYDKGLMLNQPAILEAYALYLALWVEAYEEAGIDIHHIQPQSDPDALMDSPTCAWGPHSGSVGLTPFLGGFLDDYLLPLFDSRGVPAEVWYGSFSSNQVFTSYWGDLTSNGKNAIGGIGLSWDTVNYIDTVRTNVPELFVMQSSQPPGNFPWITDSFNSSFAPNDHAFAVETWDYMVEWIEAGANAYIFPHLFLDEVGHGLHAETPWPQNSLLVVVNGNLIYTPAYYVALHVSRYVDEGAVHLETNGGDALAFQNPDDSIVTILHNSSSSAAPTTLDIDGTMLQFSIPAQGWATVNWQE